MTDSYFQGQVKACNESVSKLLGHVDQDSFYQYMRRIDGEINKTFLRSKGEKESRNKGDEGAQLLPINPCYPVGLYADTAYLPQEVFIEPQSTILFYTDGLNEAMDADNNEFGDDRILDEVNRAIQAGQLAPKALIERMTQAVHDFVGDTEQSDDLTMLVIQYHKHD